jgi:hypothetical protein
LTGTPPKVGAQRHLSADEVDRADR